MTAKPDAAELAATHGGMESYERPQPGTAVVPLGLAWLASRQSPEGSWDGDAGTTGLALLALLGTGETHQSGTHKAVVQRGLECLRERQDSDGCFIPRTSPGFPRDHAFAALAMCEAYGLTSSPQFKEPARRGVAFALTTRSPAGVWVRGEAGRAETGGESVDVETTVWMAMLLNSATMCELDATGAYKAAEAEVVAALDRITDGGTGRVGGATGGLDTAAALLARILAGRTPASDPLLRRMADAVLEEPPSLDDARAVARTYFGTMAIYQFGGRRWRRWAEPMVEAIRASARFEPGVPGRVWWDAKGAGTAAGPVRATALCCMTLSVFYRVGDRDGWRTEKWNE